MWASPDGLAMMDVTAFWPPDVNVKSADWQDLLTVAMQVQWADGDKDAVLEALAEDVGHEISPASEPKPARLRLPKLTKRLAAPNQQRKLASR